MYKRVLKTVIILCWVFLIAFALLKTIPALSSKFAIVVNNKKLVGIGNFIDERPWLQQIVYCVTTILVYHFYLCACVSKWHLSLKETLFSLAFILPNQVLTYFLPQIGSVIAFIIMFTLPFLLKANYRTVVIIFATHTLGQLVISYIRGEALYQVSMNTVTQMIMLIDMYVWLLLYYLYSNLYKEKNFMGTAAPPIWDKMNKEIKAEIAKIDAKLAGCDDENCIAKLQDRKAEYEKMLADTSNEK